MKRYLLAIAFALGLMCCVCNSQTGSWAGYKYYGPPTSNGSNGGAYGYSGGSNGGYGGSNGGSYMGAGSNGGAYGYGGSNGGYNAGYGSQGGMGSAGGYGAGSSGGGYGYARYQAPIQYSYVPYQQNGFGYGSYYGQQPVYVYYVQ
jgi:hypothetical protein